MSHVTGQIEDYCGGMLSADERTAFELHLAGCPRCKAELQAVTRAQQCLEWLVPAEAPPVPGPYFYERVRQSIAMERSAGWLGNFVTAMQLRLAYPLAVLCLLLVAWTLTMESREPYEGLIEFEYPAREFAQMSFEASEQGTELVVMSLVGMPEE
jgi:anti-sigma factor RsiW